MSREVLPGQPNDASNGVAFKWEMIGMTTRLIGIEYNRQAPAGSWNQGMEIQSTTQSLLPYLGRQAGDDRTLRASSMCSIPTFLRSYHSAVHLLLEIGGRDKLVIRAQALHPL